MTRTRTLTQMLEIVILDDYSLYIACSFVGKATRCIAGIVK